MKKKGISIQLPRHERRFTILMLSGFNPTIINETTPDPCTFNKLNPIEPNDLVSDELTKFQIVIAK